MSDALRLLPLCTFMVCIGTTVFFFVEKGPAAEATDAPCDEDEEKGDQFFHFSK
jgi:hypothetical protein